MSIDNISDISPRVQYVASASQTAFDYPFPIFADTDIVVYVNESLQTLTTHYTVSGAGDDTGGTVTFVTGRTAGQVITLWRDTSINRTVDYQQNGAITSTAINDDFDRLTIVTQELKSALGRGIRFPQTASVDSEDLELSPLSNWLSRFLYVNSSGELEPAAALTTNILTQAIIGALLYPQTTAEAAENITPTLFIYKEGDSRRYGMVGDDSTDNTTACQTWLNLGRQNVDLYLAPGIYRKGQNLVYPGTNITGASERSVLKMLPNSAKFTRLLSTEGAALWNSAVDAPVINISKISFDGNRANQGDYLAFEKEQQHHILAAANKLSAGKCRMVITNCFFKEGCADGIAIAENANVSVDNCYFNNLFRSSISMLGGYSEARITNCHGAGDVHNSRMQAEIDTTGFGGVKTAILLMDDCNWAGGMDIALDGGSFIALNNVHFAGTDVCILNLDGDNTGRLSDFTATNCFFRIATTSSSTHRFFRYGRCRFNNCTFEYTNAISHTNLIQPGTLTKQSITFSTCNFRGDSTYHTTATVAVASATWASGLLTVNTSAVHGLLLNDYVELAGFTTDVNGVYRVSSVVDTDTITVVFPRDPGAVTVGSGTTRKRSGLNALSSSADTRANGNQMNVLGCHFDESVDCAFDMQQGGWLFVDQNHVDAGLLYDAGAAASFVFEVKIGQYTHGLKHRQMCHVTGSVSGSILEHTNTSLDVARSGFTRTSNLTGLTMRGRRSIVGSGGALSTDPCFMGDIYNRDVPLAATAQQYKALTGAQSGAAASWVVETTLP